MHILLPEEPAPPGVPLVDAPALGLSELPVIADVVRAVAAVNADLVVRLPEAADPAHAALLFRTRAADPVLMGGAPVPEWSPPAPRIETARLVLTWPTGAQRTRYYDAIVGTGIFATLSWDGPAGIEDMDDWALRSKQTVARDPLGTVELAVLERATDVMVGGVGIRRKAPGVFDVGYAFAEPFHGKGYATEVVAALAHEALVVRGARRIYAEVFVGNDASRRVLEKNDFVLEGVARQQHLKGGRPVDAWILSRTA